MCGIAGYLGTAVISPERVDACLATMGRRGPDATGVYQRQLSTGRQVVLLHSRLSIIDLDPRSNQPFRHGSKVIVTNGELYNYRELQAGFDLRTNGDTEVLLRVLDRDGLKGLDRCEGMWAFALFDEAAETLTLCRDRFGEKPLYTFADSSGVYFASEIKFLAALIGHKLAIDRTHILRYLVNGYKALYKDRSKASFFEGVREVVGGTTVTYDAQGKSTECRYWTPAFDRADEGLDQAGALELIKPALLRAVELRLRADVPLAFCLSGGVDSNALISVAKRCFDYDVHAFSIINTDARYEEGTLISTAVQELNLRYTPVPIGKEGFLPKLKQLVAQHDAPVYTITYFLHWRLMEEIAKAGYRVSVSGSGADELFSGYYHHHMAYFADMQGDPAHLSRARAAWEKRILPEVRNPYLRNPNYLIDNPRARDDMFLDADIFASFLCKPWAEAFSEQPYARQILRNRMANEAFHEALPPFLHEDDLNAMYYSIENRAPYLDRNLFDVMQQIPTKLLIADGKAKALLREAVRGIAPDAVIDNPRKIGFNAPILDLVDVSDPATRAEILNDSPIYDLVRRDRIETFMANESLRNSESKFFFYFLSAKAFMETFA